VPIGHLIKENML